MQPAATIPELTSTQAIVLGFTIRRSCYAYDIEGRMRRGVCGSFVMLDRKAVYVILGQLEVLGYVTVVQGERRWRTTGRLLDKRRRRWYKATVGGVRAYERWLLSKFNVEPERVEILGRIVSASAVASGTEALWAVLDECQAFCERREEALVALQALTVSCSGIDALCVDLVILERKITLLGQRIWIRLARAHIAAYERRHGSNGMRGRSEGWSALRNGSPGRVWQEANGEEQVTVDVE
jgi:DNA-binding PadR family transcriptional regulator